MARAGSNIDLMLKQRRDRENLVESMNQHVNADYKLRHQAN